MNYTVCKTEVEISGENLQGRSRDSWHSKNQDFILKMEFPVLGRVSRLVWIRVKL
jgi:hypothetical protein